MNYVLAGAALSLGLAALVVLSVHAREIERDLTEQLACSTHALAAQLAAHHEEQRRHIDAAAAATVVQLAAQLAALRARAVPQVEVRPAPPLHARPDEPTALSGAPRPQGAA